MEMLNVRYVRIQLKKGSKPSPTLGAMRVLTLTH